MKNLRPDFRSLLQAVKNRCSCSENPYDSENSCTGYDSSYKELLRKNRLFCSEDLACAYWMYLYSRNRKQQLS